LETFQGNIQNHQVRRLLGDQSKRGRGIARLPAHGQIRLGLQELPQVLSHQRVIVNQEQPRLS